MIPSLRSLIGMENSDYFLNQSDAKLGSSLSTSASPTDLCQHLFLPYFFEFLAFSVKITLNRAWRCG